MKLALENISKTKKKGLSKINGDKKRVSAKQGRKNANDGRKGKGKSVPNHGKSKGEGEGFAVIPDMI